MKHAWTPDLTNIAHLLEDLEARQPKPQALKTLHWLLTRAAAAKVMWNELCAERKDGVTLYELAKLVAATETGGVSPESQPVVVWLLEQVPETQEKWQQLRQLCEDMAVDHSDPPRPLSALQRSRDLDRLLALNIWNDPAELLDPRRECGYQYDELLALVDARLAREPEGAGRDRLMITRTRIARYTELDRHMKTLDEKFKQLQQWRESEGRGLTAEQLEDAAAMLRMGERGTAVSGAM